MNRLLLFIFSCCFTLSLFGQAQYRDVPGTIVSDNGYPLNSVSISVLDAPVNTKSNKKGKFILKRVTSADSIVIHITKDTYAKFCLGESDSLKLILSGNMLSLYQKDMQTAEMPILTGRVRNNETGPLSVITSKMLERRSGSTLGDAINGLVPGVRVTNGGIIIRGGNNSINLSSAAMIMLDGMETSFDHINGLSIHEIDRIEVNKDGSGFGVRGSNGVISVFMKK